MVIKFSIAVHQVHARAIITNEVEYILFHFSVRDNGYPISRRITTRLVHHFMDCNRTFPRAQTGKLMKSPKNFHLIGQTVTFHLGVLKSVFECGYFNSEDTENADETNLVVKNG